MNKKKVAWLLTAAMVATSVDSSALIASGADFSSEPMEVAQEESNATGEGELQDAASGTEDQELLPEESGAGVQEAEEPQELNFGDGSEELTQESENAGEETETQKDLSLAESENDTETFGTDSADVAVQSSEMDASMAENAVELSYKEFTRIPQIDEEQTVVFKFTAPKSGKYKVVFVCASYEYTEHVPIYDSSFEECEVEDEATVSCQEGETYYAVYDDVSYAEENVATFVPTVESFEVVQQPQMEYMVWDEEVSLSERGAVIRCNYSNGETEEFSDDDENTEFGMYAVDEYGNYSYYISQPGTYQANLIVYKHIDGPESITCQLYTLENIGQVTAQNFSDYCTERAKELTLDQEGTEEISKEDTSYYYKFKVPEDGIYSFSYRSLMDGEEYYGASYDVRYYDDQGNSIEETSERKAGETIFVKLDNYGDTGYEFAITPIRKAYVLTGLEIVSEPYDKNYVDYLDFQSTEERITPKTEGLKVKATYSDGESQILENGDEGRGGKRLNVSVHAYEHAEEDIGKLQMIMDISLDGKSTEIPLNYLTISEYFSTMDKSSVEALKLDEEKNVEWNGSRGYLYSFTPSEDDTYDFTSEGEGYTNGYILDETGTILVEDGPDAFYENFRLSKALTAGTTYYYLARPRWNMEGTSILKISKDDPISDAKIEKPKKTTLISGIDDLNYLEIKVTLTFKSGKMVTYSYGEGDFYNYIKLFENWDYDEEGNIIPGNYELVFSYGNEQIGSIPITVQTLNDYLASNQIKELTTEQDIQEKHDDGDQAIYSFTAPETGEYVFRTDASPNSSEVNVYDAQGRNVSEYKNYGTSVQVSLQKDTTYYLVVKYDSDMGKTQNYTIHVQACRTLEDIKLSSETTDLYMGIDEISYDEICNRISELDIILKFTDGSEKTVRQGDKTEDGYTVSCYVPDVDGIGEYKAVFSCGDFRAEHTITVHSIMDYIGKSAEEIPAGKRTPVKLKKEAVSVYYATVPESGYYKVSYLGNAPAEMAYYDESGIQDKQAVYMEKGQKFYFSLKNTLSREIKGLVTVEKQEAALEKLTIKSKPEKLSFVENIDYAYQPEDVADYADGLVVTAQYTDGTTEDLAYGETGRYGDMLSGRFSMEYTDNGESCFMIFSMSGENTEKIPVELIAFGEYLKDNGEKLEALTVNKSKDVFLQSNKYKVYRFVPEKDDTYNFYSVGDMDTFGYLYDQNGKELTRNDDGGTGNNFLMTYDLKAGNVYYLAAKGYNSDGESTIRVGDQNDTGTETSEELTDIQLISTPEKTVFYNGDDKGVLNINNLPYDGLKLSAKNKAGETEIYSYSQEYSKFPFTIIPDITVDEDDHSVAGEYTAKVLYMKKTVAEFKIEIKEFKDYLATVTTELKPGETVKDGICDPIEDDKYLYFKLPSDLKGTYWYNAINEKWYVYGIYNSQGKKADLEFDSKTAWDFNGQNYYLCLRKSNWEEYGSFYYDRLSSSGIVKDIEIVSQPEITEYIKGMGGNINLSGMVISIKYEDGSEKTVPVKDYTDLYNRQIRIKTEKGNITDPSVTDLSDGENTLILEFCGIQKTFQVTLSNPVDKKADALTLGKESSFTVTENNLYHVYSYVPEKDGEYSVEIRIKSSTDDPYSNGEWFCVDASGKSIERNGDLSLKAGKTYYFVPYCESGIFGDMYIKLTESANEDVMDETDILDLEITAPTKTTYTIKDTISYDGMKIRAIYDDGTEKEFTAKEAQKKGIYITDNVEENNGISFPGNYKITVSYTDSYDNRIEKSVPIKVEDTGVQKLDLSGTPLEVKLSEDGAVYEYDVAETGYYQFAITLKAGSSVSLRPENRGWYTEYYADDETQTKYTSLFYLKAGKNYLFLSGDGQDEKENTCSLGLLTYSSAPKSIQFIKDSAKTEFTYGETVDFRGMQFKVTYEDNTEKIVTIPENYKENMTLESGLILSGINSSAGKHEINAEIQGELSKQCSTSVSYTVAFAKDMAELENGKTYTLKAGQLKDQVATYSVKGSDKGDEICQISYDNAAVEVYEQDGSWARYVSSYEGASGVISFVAEKGETYYVIVGKEKEFDISEDSVFKFSGSKVITKITALPEENATYYYGYGTDEYDMTHMKLQLTYEDGSTEVLSNEETSTDMRGYLANLQMENIAGPGTYQGILTFGNLRTSYSRKFENPEVTELKINQYTDLESDGYIRRFRFAPTETKRYYYQNETPLYDEIRLRLRNEGGALLGSWYVGESSAEMVLTAGKVYYFDVSSYGSDGFTLTDEKPVTVKFKEDVQAYEYTGEEIKPEFTVTRDGKELAEGKDYQIIYHDNKNVGKATAEITPVSGGISFAKKTVSFEIFAADLKKAGAEIESIPKQDHTGEEITPEVKVTINGKVLEQDKDYIVQYTDNVDPGTATVTVEGIGNYEGVIESTFEIAEVSRDFTKAEITGINPSYYYTGKEITPVPVVKFQGEILTKGTDYEVSYTDNIKAGTATVTILGKGLYKGEVSVNFKIAYKLVNKITLNKTKAYVVAGNSLQLSATIAPTDAYNRKVTWTSSNQALATVSTSGKVTVKVNATGGSNVVIKATAADGSKVYASCTITINNKITYYLNGGKQNSNNKTTFRKQTVKLYNPTRKGYTFGGWYTDKTLKKKVTSISSKTVKNVVLYAKWVKVSKCAAPSGVTLKNSKAKTAAVSYKAVSGAKGYEISYATNNKFSGAKKVLTAARTRNIGNLSKGKTYYVRIRAYKIDSTGAKVYGNYSKTVKVTIKK